MVALYTARIFEFYVEHWCSGRGVVVRESRQSVNCVIVFIWFSRFTWFTSEQALLASSGVWGKFSTHSFFYHFQTFFIVINIFLHLTHIYANFFNFLLP